MVNTRPLETAIARAGSQSALARAIGVPQPYVWRWLRQRGGVVPAEAAIAIEKAVGVPRHELRPDLWSKESAA
jgi:DNA-binding transcriptional regulator YdaS (Cro superfamily)